MPSYRFYQLDVFTDQPLAGNPLAVFPDATGLAPATMQALAREMNLSETTFVLPSDKATRRVRIFTPTAELPLAGHPVIGTWWLLAERGLITLPAGDSVRITQETGAGVLPVDIELAGGRPTRVIMTQSTPQWGPLVKDTTRLAKALGGNSRTIKAKPLPQVVSTAVPQMMIPVSSLKALQALPSGGAGAELVTVLRRYGTDCAMCYSLETEGRAVTAHCRMFAPGLGVPEDPATGSAAGALGAYLVKYNVVPAQFGTAIVTIEQGLEIGRPSLIEVFVTATDAGISEVRVGGKAVTIMEGEVRL